MELKVKIGNPNIWYNDDARQWRLGIAIITDNVALCETFSDKKKNKVKTKFYKWCTKGILAEEMEYLFKQHKIYFKEE